MTRHRNFSQNARRRPRQIQNRRRIGFRNPAHVADRHPVFLECPHLKRFQVVVNLLALGGAALNLHVRRAVVDRLAFGQVSSAQVQVFFPGTSVEDAMCSSPDLVPF